MRQSAAALSIAALLGAAGLAGSVSCAPARPAESVLDEGRFSAQRAWTHLQALVAIGPRVAGTPGAASARDYLRGELEKLRLEVREDPFTLSSTSSDTKLEGVHLTGILPGDSSDIILLAAHYDTQRFDTFGFVGANDGGSGPALLLELARVLSIRKPPYTFWFTFFDAEAPLTPDSGPEQTLIGSRAFAALLAQENSLDRIRLGVVFNQVADADLRIARDLRSHRVHREIFWSAAVRMGRRQAFPTDAPFDAPLASHVSFSSVGMRRMVAIVDSRYGGEADPGAFARTEEDTLAHCAPESLETVGIVTLAGLDDIMALLRRVDRYARPAAADPTKDAPDAGNGDPTGTPQDVP